jgi:dTDP-4-amino-4,6-dideoxygalactose transaminase
MMAVPLTRMELREEDVAAVLECYRSGWLTMGPRTQAFETALAAATGATDAVAVASGTAAVQLALLAAGVRAGDEVIVPALTFPAAAAVVRACGATAVVCDVVGPDDHTLDAEAAAARVGPATRAILADHRWGYPCDTTALRAICDRHGLRLVEDAAHAISAEGVGGADLTCYSLSATKQLGVGEGGAVTADDPALVAAVRSLRSHAMTSVTWDRHRGHARSYDVVAVGHNHRIDEPRAALGLSRLPRLAADVDHRRRVVRAYREALADVDGLTIPFGEDAVRRGSHGAFGVLFATTAARDAARGALAEDGVETALPSAVHVDTALPSRAAEVVARGLRLPLSAVTTLDDVATVHAALRRAAPRQPPGSSRS